MTSGIYQIKNLHNNKVYIGQSENIEERFNNHKSELKRQKHHSKHLQNSWNKYGEEYFDFSIIEECFIEELDDKEEFWINKKDSLNNGYNMVKGGHALRGKDNPFYGKKHSEETKRKISKALTGKKHTLETIEKIKKNHSDFWTGHKHTEESKQKMREKHLGKKLSKKHKENISKAISGKNNPFYGKKHNEKTKEQIRDFNLKAKNNTQYIEIRKITEKRAKQGFIYGYFSNNNYSAKNKKKSSVNIEKVIQWAKDNNMPLTRRED